MSEKWKTKIASLMLCISWFWKMGAILMLIITAFDLKV